MAGSGDPRDGVGTVGGKQLLADLQSTNSACQNFGKIEHGTEIGRIHGAQNSLSTHSAVSLIAPSNNITASSTKGRPREHS